MFQKKIPSVLFLAVLLFTSTVYAGKVELTTYYPSPSGEYDRLQSTGSCVGTDCGASAADVIPGILKVKKSAAGTGGDLNVENTATIATANITGNATISGNTVAAGGFVLPKKTGTFTPPTSEGSLWIE